MAAYLIFDKSFLESLTADEAIWLDNYFTNNITPLFYVETLADLNKSSKKGKIERSPEQLVSELASKTPTMHAVPGIHHLRLVLGDMLGREVSWAHHRPIIGGGEYNQLPDGRVVIDFKQFPESAALERWKSQEFKTIEEQIASDWREALSNLTFDDLIKKAEALVPEDRKLSSEKDVFKLVGELVSSKHNQFIYAALDFLDLPEKARSAILKRWHQTRPLPFNQFAPYAAHVLKVDLFFYICLSKSFISKDRPSNKIDLAYLYYLPFCMIFVSNDKLHIRTVPLFLEEDQQFVSGEELKADFRKINDHFLKLPDDIKKRGVYLFAQFPPHDIDTLVGRLHDKFLRPWRKSAEEHLKNILKPLDKSETAKRMSEERESRVPYKGPPIDSDQAHSMTITQKVPVKKGNWFLFPPEIIDAALKKRGGPSSDLP